jgi:PKD repeat protein
VASEVKILSQQPYIPPFKAQYYGPLSLVSGTRLRVKLFSSGTVKFFIQDRRQYEDFMRLGPEWAVGYFYNKTNKVDIIFTVPSTDDWFFLIGNVESNGVDVSLEVYEQTKWYEFHVGVAKEFYKKDDNVILSAKLESNQPVSYVEVRFRVLDPLGVCIFNCSKNTDAYGRTNVTFSISTEEGNYIALAETLVDYSKIIGNNASFIVDLTPPVAIFIHSPLNPKRGETITFNASASYDELSTIVSYGWDFGDGTTGIGITTNHNYATSGNYTVTLKVSDNASNFNTHTTVITVEEPFNPLFIGIVVAMLGFVIVSIVVWIVTKRKRKNTVK